MDHKFPDGTAALLVSQGREGGGVPVPWHQYLLFCPVCHGQYDLLSLYDDRLCHIANVLLFGPAGRR